MARPIRKTPPRHPVCRGGVCMLWGGAAAGTLLLAAIDERDARRAYRNACDSEHGGECGPVGVACASEGLGRARGPLAGVRGVFAARARSGGRGVAARAAPGFLVGAGGSRGVARIFRIGFPGLLRVRIFRAGLAWLGLPLLFFGSIWDVFVLTGQNGTGLFCLPRRGASCSGWLRRPSCMLNYAART